MTAALPRANVGSRLAIGGSILVALALFFAYMVHNRGFAVDDSYITFRYVQNALAGHGLVFNVGQHYYGSTATGYAVLLLCIVKLLSWIGILVDIHQVSTALSAISIAGIAWLCAWSVARGGGLPRLIVGAALAVGFAVLPLSNVVAAHETYFYLALLAWAGYLAVIRRMVWQAVVLLIVAHAVRPDSLLFALVLLAAMVVAGFADPVRAPLPTRRVLGLAVAFAVGVIAWLVAMKLYYGTFLPGTMDAKKAQIVLGDFVRFEPSSVFPTLDQQFSGRAWPVLLLLPLAALSRRVMHAWRTPARAFALTPYLLLSGIWLVFAVGLLCAYWSFNVTIWPWYVAPIGVSLVISAACAIGDLMDEADAGTAGPVRRRALPPAILAVVVVLACLVATMSPTLRANAQQFFGARNVNGHLHAYDGVVAYLREHEPGGTSIAMAEPGTFGFRMGPNYQVLDTLGLASPGVAKALRQGDRGYALRTWRPKYYVASWDGSYNLERLPGFKDQYEVVATLGHPYWDATLHHGIRLYRRKADAGDPGRERS